MLILEQSIHFWRSQERLRERLHSRTENDHCLAEDVKA